MVKTIEKTKDLRVTMSPFEIHSNWIKISDYLKLMLAKVHGGGIATSLLDPFSTPRMAVAFLADPFWLGTQALKKKHRLQ